MDYFKEKSKIYNQEKKTLDSFTQSRYCRKYCIELYNFQEIVLVSLSS